MVAQLCEYPLHRQADSQPLRHQGSPKLVCFKKVKKMSFFLAMPCGIRDLNSPTRDQTCAPCMGSVQSSPPDRQGSP